MRVTGFTKLFLACMPIIFHGNSTAMEMSCRVEYGGSTVDVTAKPGADRYQFNNDDSLGDFRFSLQYLSDIGKVKTYVYHHSKNRYVLIHAAEYQVAEAACRQYQTGFGLNRVYSAKLEKELTFQCFSVCP